MPGLLVLMALGIGLIIYALFGVFTSGQTAPEKQKKNEKKLDLSDDLNKDQKIQRLQKQIAALEEELKQAKIGYEKDKVEFVAAKEKEAKFADELKRREEWVARAEAELSKIKPENLDLKNKFILKETELQEGFAKNVNLSREIRQIKTSLDSKEAEIKLKDEQLEIQKHQIEKQLKSISEHTATIAEFSRKEKISEWVPKTEFNKLNEEYTKLEKELESSQERLKSFAVEIAHLRQLDDKKVPVVEEVKLAEVIPEEIKQEKAIPKEAKPEENKLEEIKPEEIKQEGEKLEENKIVEEIKVVEEVRIVEENIEKKPEETEDQK